MKLTISPTPHFFMSGDVMVRMWTGTDQNGCHVVALVTAVAFDGQAEALAEGLISIPPPDEAAARKWAEEVMSGRPYKEEPNALD
jgi:hypothetical protein